MCTIRCLAKTGFHVSCSFSITGPPAVSGFPYIHAMASSQNRLPCVRRSLQWASHVVGLPSCTPCGLRHPPAFMHFTVSSSPGVPLSRAFSNPPSKGLLCFLCRFALAWLAHARFHSSVFDFLQRGIHGKKFLLFDASGCPCGCSLHGRLAPGGSDITRPHLTLRLILYSCFTRRGC